MYRYDEFDHRFVRERVLGPSLTYGASEDGWGESTP